MGTIDQDDDERQKRIRRGREHLDQLTRYALVTDADGYTRAEAPGLYVRLFDAVSLGGTVELGGPRQRGKSAGSPAPLRVDVVDAIAAVESFARTTQRIQRRASGWIHRDVAAQPDDAPAAENTATTSTAYAAARARWGLEPHSAAAGGSAPDHRVLDALDWINTAYELIQDGPGLWPDDVAEQLFQATSTARRLLGLSRVRVDGAKCPYCELGTIYSDQADADLVVCINVLCLDENGNPPEWRDVAQWAAIDTATPKAA